MATTDLRVLGMYRRFIRLLKWWPEQREDENCLKVIAYNQVRDGFKQGKMLKDTLEIEKALERADKEYRYFVNIGSNLHRENVSYYLWIE